MSALHRRRFFGLCAALLAEPALAQASGGATKAWSFGFDRAEGGRFALEAFRGRPILIVNTATACGFAGQFAGLEQLWQRYRTRGLMLIAVPSKDFGGQEPLEGAAIAEAVRQSYGASYPFMRKAVVKGPDAHPFYRWAATRRPLETPSWNFHKYLVGRDGDLVAGFGTRTDPVGPDLVRAIGRELDAG